jgi:hypothetical protein
VRFETSASSRSVPAYGRLTSQSAVRSFPSIRVAMKYAEALLVFRTSRPARLNPTGLAMIAPIAKPIEYSGSNHRITNVAGMCGMAL